MEYINIFDISISTYAIFVLLGFFNGLIVVMLLDKNTEKESVILLYLISIIGFIFGAKLLYCILNKSESFLTSGYAYTGGIIGSILVLVIYSKITKTNFEMKLDYYSTVYPLIYSIAKIGCYFAGCCGGLSIYNIIPLQLFESTMMLILFLILLRVKEKASYFFILYGILRFMTDYVRNKRNLFFYNISITQIICFLFILIGLMRITQNKIFRKDKEWNIYRRLYIITSIFENSYKTIEGT